MVAKMVIDIIVHCAVAGFVLHLEVSGAVGHRSKEKMAKQKC